jgi:glycerophosphoryl diester phosphodiesterase
MLRLYGSLNAIGNTTFEELTRISSGEVAAYDDVMGILKKRLNIEIKSRGDKAEDERLADEIIADIRARGRGNDVMISSISGDVITYIHQKHPDIPTGQVFWLTASTYLHVDALTGWLYDEVAGNQADYLMLHVANLHNIEDLLRLKPGGQTIVFWDFDDRIFIVHKDISDRLWGDSLITSFFQFARFKLVSAFGGI